MEQEYLPRMIREGIQDLMKSKKVTQAELATRIDCSESMLSRFLSGKTDKLGDENICHAGKTILALKLKSALQVLRSIHERPYDLLLIL